ncbi:MAG: AraC family transcriptional regulator [Kiritimatiellales bacterium]|nr:AraC family transcriptional regulator [Kiritimatiellales bacterium]
MNKAITEPQRIDLLIPEFSDRRFPDFGTVGWCRYAVAQPKTLFPHRHQGAYEICFLRGGSTFWQVGTELFRVQPGEIFLTWPDELHGGEGQAMHPCELYWMIFRLSGKKGSFGLSARQTRQLDDALRAVPSRTFKAPAGIGEHFDRLLNAFSSPCPFSETIIQSTIQTILCDVAKSATSKPGAKRSACSPRIQKAINRLHADGHAAMTIGQMAATAGLKPSYFREQFKKETGYSPGEYQTLLRIQAAKLQLMESDAPITDIAFDLGFSSSQYFASCFRKTTGTSPRDFRKLNGSDRKIT